MIQQFAHRVTALPFARLFGVAAIAAGTLSGPSLITCRGIAPALAAELAQRSHGLHAALLAVCASLAVVLFAALLYSIMSARMRHAGHETPAMRKPRPIKEALWALIPIAIVIGAAAPAVRVYLSDTGATASASSTGGNAAFQCRLAGARGTE